MNIVLSNSNAASLCQLLNSDALTEIKLYVSFSALRAAVQGLARSSDLPLKGLVSLELTARTVSCECEGCPTATHSRGMARELGEELETVLATQGFPAVARLQRLKLDDCMMIDGLSKMADKVETVRCWCDEDRFDHEFDTAEFVQRWHDPPLPDEWTHPDLDPELVSDWALVM